MLDLNNTPDLMYFLRGRFKYLIWKVDVILLQMSKNISGTVHEADLFNLTT